MNKTNIFGHVLLLIVIIASILGSTGCATSASAQTIPTSAGATVGTTPTGTPAVLTPTAPPPPVTDPARRTALTVAAMAAGAATTAYNVEQATIAADWKTAQAALAAEEAKLAMVSAQSLSQFHGTRAVVDSTYGVLWTNPAIDGLSAATEVKYLWNIGGQTNEVTIPANVLPNGVYLRFAVPSLPANTDVNVTIVGCQNGIPTSLPDDGNIWLSHDANGRWLGFKTPTK